MNKFLPAKPASASRDDAGAVYADPFATFRVARDAAPTSLELVIAMQRDLDRAIADVENRIARWRYQPSEIDLAEEAADAAADEADRIAWAAEAQAEADRIADGIEAGDLDADGEPIGYPTYRSI